VILLFLSPALPKALGSLQKTTEFARTYGVGITKWPPVIPQTVLTGPLYITAQDGAVPVPLAPWCRAVREFAREGECQTTGQYHRAEVLFGDKSTSRASTALPETVISPTEIGSLNRLGPQLPGLTYRIPLRSSIFG
jgi:hypothetical protein